MTAKSKTLAAGHRVSVRLPKGTSTSYVQDSTITLAPGDVLTITAEKPAPPPPPPPTPGLPVIPAEYGRVFRKVFTDGTLAPFRVRTYPDDHPTDNMAKYNRFANGGKQVFVHDGYCDIRATRRPDGLWDACLLATSQGGDGQTFGYGVFRFWCRANPARGAWQSAWLYDTTKWTSTEIDWPEVLEGGALSAHVIGSGAGKWYGKPPADWATTWHEFRIERRTTFVAFAIDGTEVARVSGSMPSSPLAILLDSKLGFPWAEGPDATTPEVYFHVAAVTVDL